MPRKRRNIEMGFYDASGFHPIRSSSDYSKTRAGELKLKSGQSVRSFLSKRKNVAMGYMDAGGTFHPIRASSDYSKTRAGELKLRSGRSVRSALTGRKNPAKGRKVKGGRGVTLHNFTGTVTRLSNGQVIVRGRGKQ